MHVTLVHISIKPDCRAEFLEATRINHEASVEESGNRRFDVLSDPEDATRFVLYEWYDTPDDAVSHKKTGHFETWRDTVAPMMAADRELEVLRGIYPIW
ncbi:antibiotic biosynthesis monooxygenase [bacterium]|nr:antibiotic biosynthesis monooxygenase [bacterium]